MMSRRGLFGLVLVPLAPKIVPRSERKILFTFADQAPVQMEFNQACARFVRAMTESIQPRAMGWVSWPIRGELIGHA